MSGRRSVSEGTEEQILAVLGARGRTWLDGLDGTVAELRERWRLRAVGPAYPGRRTGLVAPAEGADGRLLVLKVVPDAEWARTEAAALAHWDGRGAVPLVAFDAERSALLLDRVEPGRTLAEARLPEGEAVGALTDVIAALPGGRPPPGLPSPAHWVGGLRPREEALPGVLEAAREEARELASVLLASSRDVRVLHGDLHHDNILRDGERWVAADPKGLVGPAEAEPAVFLRNPWSRILADPDPFGLVARRVDVVVDRLGYDRDRVVAWARVLGVLSAVWAWEDGAPAVDREGALEVAALFRV